MEKLSRVKKYEDLRKQIEDTTSGVDTLPEKQLQGYAQRLNEIDPSIFKKVTLTEAEPYVPERERKVTASYQEQTKEQPTGEFRNEYLDDFINEVREYNIKKGNRENENTQIDILNQLQASSRAKRSNYVETISDEPQSNIEDTTASLSKAEIVAQLKDFIWESEAEEETVEEPIILTSPIEAPKKVVQPIREAINVVDETREIVRPQMDREEIKTPVVKEPLLTTPVTEEPRRVIREASNEEIREKQLHQKLVEETQQLRVQLNEYEDDLNGLSEGVEKTNKMLNVILGCLILALLVIIGIIVYWIVQAGGLM